MDPAALASSALYEVARDGVHGTTVEAALERVVQRHGALSDAARVALGNWLRAHPDVNVADGHVFASAARQWRVLTGGEQADSAIGELAFALLSLISRRRAAGVTTVEAAKLTQQDPRSIFGRVQLLVDLGLVVRFPVIEGGNATHRLLFHSEAARRGAVPGAVDIERLGRHVVEFCAAGPHGLRLARDVVAHLSSDLAGVAASRRRPVAMRIVRVLEARQCVRRLYMYDPARADVHYSVVEYRRPYRAGSEVVEGAGSDGSDDEADGSDAEGDTETVDAKGAAAGRAMQSNKGAEIDLSRARAVESHRTAHAHTALPLSNQLFAAVFASRGAGEPAMALTRALTGTKYRKSFAKYLEALTETRRVPPHWSHLVLVRGMDFHHKVKFYRYFARRYFPRASPPDPAAGTLPDAPPAPPSRSLRTLALRVGVPIPGACSVVRLDSGQIVPSFHGDSHKGAVLCISKGEPRPGDKKRGRPPKSRVQKKAPPRRETIDPALVNEDAPRLWSGGTPLTPADLRASTWLDGADKEDHGSRSEEGELPLKTELRELREIADTPAVEREPESGSQQPLSSSTNSTPKHGAVSLANAHRAELVLQIVREHEGAVVSGAALIALFADRDSRASTIDRKTMNRVTAALVADGRLAELPVHVGAGTKTVLYDPQVIPDVSVSPRIASLRHELTEGQRQKHADATRAAVEAVRARTTAVESRALSAEQLAALKPRPQRVLSTRGARARASAPRQRFGPSAAEMLGLDTDGTRALAPKRARSERSERVEKTERAERLAAGARPSPRTTPAVDSDMLMRAVIVYRCLYATKTNVDWQAVAAALPGLSPTAAKKTWPSIKAALLARDSQVLQRHTKRFETLFRAHLAQNTLELFDSTRVQEAVLYYAQWWRSQDAQDARGAAASASYIPLAERLAHVRLRDAELPSSLVDPFASLQHQLSVLNAEKLLASAPFGAVEIAFVGIELSAFARRIRSVIAADAGPTFSASAAARELADIPEEEATAAIKQLERLRLVQWAESDASKTPLGRPYVLSDRVRQTLSPRVALDAPARASEYLGSLSIGTKFPVTGAVQEHEMIVLLALTRGLDGKRVRYTRTNEKFGMIAESYKSRGIDKNAFECELECEVVEDASSRATASPTGPIAPPQGDPAQPWVWQTELLTSNGIWYAVQLKLVVSVLFRPGITAATLAFGLRHALLEAETLVAVDALVQGRALYEGAHAALFAATDWFIHFEASDAELAKAVLARARGLGAADESAPDDATLEPLPAAAPDRGGDGFVANADLDMLDADHALFAPDLLD